MHVEITKQADRQVEKAPVQVRRKLKAWILQVTLDGLEATRLQPGWHDEPLKGYRKGQRSIRLNAQWRAIYEITQTHILLTILEVTPHDY